MIKFLFKALFAFSILAFMAFVTKKQIPSSNPITPPFLNAQSHWVDSVFNSLNPDQRLAQLFMVAAYSNKDMKHVAEIRELVEKYNIGGLIFMQGGPLREAKLNNYYQSKAKTPLLISIDGEWGLAMRLDSTPKYPRQMTLGAIKNDSLIYYMGKQIARECKRMGIHVNFAPVADVNNNPLNPVIGMRSFGENKYKVATKAIMYMKGLQAEGVMANGKHFPGHGDTDSDSHKTLPIISACKERLDTLELYPFQQLFDNGLSSIMVAHLFVPCYDTTKNTASTLSPYIIQDLLKKQLGFQGLIFTDALNMKGVASFYEPGMVDVKALLAGNDVLLFAENVPKAMEQIKLAISKGQITQEEIDARCKKILKAKFWCGLDKNQYVSPKNLYEDLNTKESFVMNTKLAEASVTLLKNDNALLPLQRLDTMKIIEVSIGDDKANTFSETINKYSKISHLGISHDASKKERDTLFAKLKNYNWVILQVNKTSYKPEKDFGCSAVSFELISKIFSQKNTIACFYSNPYLMNKLENLNQAKSILNVYEYSQFSQKAAADAIMGAIEVNGTLPVTTKLFVAGTGLEVKKKIRVQYVTPEQIGVDSKKLLQVDSIAQMGIKEHAYPGCQIVAIKSGKVFYQKNFGKQTYEASSDKVNDQTVYDLASLTKILSSSLALMKLSEQKQFDYEQHLDFYFPELAGTDKSTIHYKDMLTHQSGLPAWLPFWQKTVDKKSGYKSGYYSDTYSEEYPVQVAKGLYVVKDFNDSIYNQIMSCKMEETCKYVYSDIGYYFSKILIEKLTKTKLNTYVQTQFYKPMNLGLTYLPLSVYPESQIAPTENDLKFRKQLVRGYVHDQGAALMGGVAGHAGLFGNANDVGVLMQMLLNKGEYGGQRLLDSSVIKQYTSSHFSDNRRGLCFDKPEPNEKKDSPVTKECSLKSFGHSGFTGTFAWADPENDLIFVFLSNRVYPSADENKLAKLGVRGKIHRILYEAVKPSPQLLN
ncbi:MAG TPA: glycoside hydrolase family 3 N-terminal domain-containing protein [Bacteroidia bacterium]|nr:glycoside hydrolase family 3 N-terminal domain-containing protein [Bacteroidia bacterium]